MKIPLFKTDKDLAAFVDKLSAEEISSLNTEDWNRLYAQINKLCTKLSKKERFLNRLNLFYLRSGRLFGFKPKAKFYNPTKDFLQKHKSVFTKLNKYYRPEEAHRQKVIAAARRLAQELCAASPEIKSRLTNFMLASDAERLQTMAKIRDITYREIFAGRAQRKPSIQIAAFSQGLINGEYSATTNQISINREVLSNSLYTFAHELWHSTQTLGRAPKELTKLYGNNRCFYLSSDADFTAYRRQPLEYDVRTFQIYFTSEIFKQIGAENFSVGDAVASLNRFMYYRRRDNEQTKGSCKILADGHLHLQAPSSENLRNDLRSLNHRFLDNQGRLSEQNNQIDFDFGRPGKDLNKRLANAVFNYRPCFVNYPKFKQVCQLFAADADIKAKYKFFDLYLVCKNDDASPAFKQLQQKLKDQDLATCKGDSFYIPITKAHLSKLRNFYFINRLQNLGVKTSDIKIGEEDEKTLLAVASPSPEVKSFLKLLSGTRKLDETADVSMARFKAQDTLNLLSERRLFLPQKGLSPHLFEHIRQRT